MKSEEIKSLLFEFREKLKLLKSILIQKQTAILEFDYEMLEDIIESEELLLKEIASIRGKFDFSGDTLKVFIETDVQLKSLRDEVDQEIEIIKRLNNEVRYLITHSLLFVRKLLDLYHGQNKINTRI
ncbi:MAG: flagellar export chaperone FlgN [Candidatus Kryptonium sp.]|nr:flagellar protein FlgN [Candidatus Kryptonium sp.]MCX7762080.1 flagellar protein FlgN [Candidatus Kryptonium sp.]MDW8108316.1 flagellar export chaperone FlgN [Candidatus Kryptonium sp.]